MIISFSTPWLLLTAIPVAALVVASVLRSHNSRLSSIALALLRTATAVCVIAALAGPHTTTERAADELAALVDISASMTPTQGEALLSRAQKISRDLNVPLRVVPFGANAAASPTTNTFGELRR